MDINKEFLIDQIMSYTIQAGEVLKADFLLNKKTLPQYQSLFLPSGPDFYTGPLKAAGYLLLQPKIKKIILIYKQDKFVDQVTVYTAKEKVVLGSSIKIQTPIIHQGLTKTSTISQEINEQLVFLRLLTSIEQVVILGVGTAVSSVKTTKIITDIKGKNSEYGCVFFDTCSSDIAMEQGKKLDEYIVKQVFLQKTNKKIPNWLGNTFVLTAKHYKQKPDIVGYFNSGDFGGNPSKSTGYACIVA